jgi:phage-related protein
MTQETLLAIFTGVLAFAVLMQTLIFFGIYKAIRQLTAWLDSLGKNLLGNIEAISGKADEALATIKEIGNGVKPITGRLSDTTDVIYKRVAEVDAFLAETTNAARVEILRIQAIIDSASRRVEEIFETVQNSILAPINEIAAIARGIRVGLDMLFRRRRNPAGTSPHDEEMFI